MHEGREMTLKNEIAVPISSPQEYRDYVYWKRTQLLGENPKPIDYQRLKTLCDNISPEIARERMGGIFIIKDQAGNIVAGAEVSP